MADYTEDYLLDKRVKIFQPLEGYRASTDAVLLASLVSKIKKGDNILDVGSGTGAISLCLAERLQDFDITIKGLEQQSLLAELANLSAEANGFDFLSFDNENIFEAKHQFCSFAHVITNPPYSEHDMPSPNASKAAAHNFGEADLQAWINFCIKMIKPQGYFYMINRAEALADILAAIKGKLGEIVVIPLYSKSGQDAKRVLIKARKDSKKALVVSQGLVVHDEQGGYTSRAHGILRDGKSLD